MPRLKIDKTGWYAAGRVVQAAREGGRRSLAEWAEWAAFRGLRRDPSWWSLVETGERRPQDEDELKAIVKAMGVNAETADYLRIQWWGVSDGQ